MSRESILIKCQENIETLNALAEDNSISEIIKIMAKPLKERVERIQDICNVDKYTLTFIGSVGVGKSTAISNLIGLIDESVLSKYENAETFLQDIPLLKTAEGRTTLCETIIRYTENECNSVKIEKLPQTDFEQFVEQYCSYVQKEGDNDDKSECSIEIQRVIANMARIPNRVPDKTQMLEYIKSTFADEYNENISFKDTILKSVHYQERSLTLLEYNDESEQSLEEWIKANISAINNGEDNRIPFPRKIIITLTRGKMSEGLPQFIDEIQDTRGLDDIAVREDIIDACYDFKKICVFCDTVTSYGNIITNTFLKNHFIEQNSDFKHKCLLLGLEKGSQLKKTNGATGRETGKDSKKQEALDRWNNNVCLTQENMYFYNAFFGISYDQDETITGFNNDKYRNERNAVFGAINNIVQRMYESYDIELKEINEQLNVFFKNTVNDEQKSKLENLKEIIRQCKSEVSVTYNKCFFNLENEIRKQVNASQLRASVRRNGAYESYNIYSNIGNFCFAEFDAACSKHIFHIKKSIENLFDSNNELEQALKTALNLKLQSLFLKYRYKDSTDLKEIMQQKLYQEPIWNQMSCFWGQKNTGEKYRDRIANHLFEEVKKQQISQIIVIKDNTRSFFNEIDSFLQINC